MNELVNEKMFLVVLTCHVGHRIGPDLCPSHARKARVYLLLYLLKAIVFFSLLILE